MTSWWWWAFVVCRVREPATKNLLQKKVTEKPTTTQHHSNSNMAVAAFSPRASLLSDAKKFTSLRRWSIRQLLLEFNSGDTTALSTTTTSPSTTNSTQALLREMQIRLASQHSKLVSFSNSFEKYTKIFHSEERSGVNNVHRNLSNLQILHENTYLLLQNNFTKGSGHDDDSLPLLQLDSTTTTADAPTNNVPATSLQKQ